MAMASYSPRYTACSVSSMVSQFCQPGLLGPLYSEGRPGLRLTSMLLANIRQVPKTTKKIGTDYFQYLVVYAGVMTMISGTLVTGPLLVQLSRKLASPQTKAG